MKTLASLFATAALVAGIAVANAQSTQRQDEQAGGTNQAIERNPSGAPVGSQSNPSPTTGAGTAERPPMGAPGSRQSLDEQAGGTGQAIERNPDGSTGGSKAAPSR